jgi:hypothetical protein
MSFTGDPANSATDRIRLIVGDTNNQFEYLTDDVYEYLLAKYKNAETPTALEAARYILGSLARLSRQRTGDIEVYGAEMFNNYKAFLVELLRNPQLLLDRAAVYAGGISKVDMERNDLNTDNVQPRFYRGFSENKRIYEDDDGVF